MVINIARCILCGILLIEAGCGYRLATYPDLSGKAVAVPIFVNRTLRPNIETCLTSSVIQQFAGSGGAKIVPPAEAELLLAGEVLSYSDSASAFSAADQVVMYKSTMAAEATLRQVKSGKVIWKGTVSAVQDYQIGKTIPLQVNVQEAARSELCRKLAESILRESGDHF